MISNKNYQKYLKKKIKEKEQVLSANPVTNTENTNIDLFFGEEFDEGFLEVDIEAVDPATNDEPVLEEFNGPALEEFFNIRTFEQNIIEEGLAVRSQSSDTNEN